jgi:hypothetical protein
LGIVASVGVGLLVLRVPPAAVFFGGFAAVTGIALSVDQLFVKNLVAEIDALITDVDPRTRDQFAHLLLGLSAERALQMGVKFGHRALDTSNGKTEPVGVGSD